MTLTVETAVQTAPEWAFFDVEVAAVRRLGPSFVRLTFTGPDLAGFGVAGDDQRIKLVLAQDPAGLRRLMDRGSDWYPEYCAMPEEQRPWIRTYTVRAARPELAEVDVDVVLHGVDDGHAGPAARWAASAVPGDRIVLLGPDRPGRGRMWGVEWAPPAAATTLLLAGDETAVPAVCSILESSLGEARRVMALLEVPAAGDAMNLALPAGVTVRWLPRSGAARGSLLVPAVHAALCELGVAATPAEAPEDVDVDSQPLWEVPEGGRGDDGAASSCYAWLAGEAGVVKQLRRHLVGDLGVPRGSVAFMGYWRQGIAG
ncbi:siderophore-interacting protein [Geodermatophilus sabuli]|uniref:NADPH-dependent ferric siderophore reductase, contains FAD-binding and SIP domains n=1 Tax=Geodermatophilus sabuli TaxID=1564158 RepID=A0A285E8I9_9ACTN|nr:siderophore-interacting protein [Geodermatophilus sabuli]MBB3085266.1 NADPH-dependent ferric siderophore reductase [Geodermatophilus sabuli]SNX95327.1 NADPH-dependent ferric siderophore reductase, contains FAD-binding and SIP domains [Geodermatophilus sabuli]